MTTELVFAVQAHKATEATQVTFAAAGLQERKHLQEWVIANPSILGPGIMIVTFEFDRWVTSTGESTSERLDVLGLDESGRLVVAELKRDRAPDSVTMQALNYAAMVSRFNLDTLAETFAASKLSGGVSKDEALAALQSWAPAISDETLGAPRIVLLATEFGPTVTNLALFLYENGIDIQLTRVQPYRTADGHFLVTVSRILPVPNAEEFMVKPRSAVQLRSSGVGGTSRSDWSWDAYAELFSPQRIELARRILDRLSMEVQARALPWSAVFRKGYVAFQRKGGYNVIVVDLMWNRPVRVAVKLPAPPGELGVESPYPELEPMWTTFKEWGWHIEAETDLTDVGPMLDLAEKYNSH